MKFTFLMKGKYIMLNAVPNRITAILSAIMDKKPVDISGICILKRFYAFLLVSIPYFSIFVMHQDVPDLFYTRNIAASLGGGSALYFLFLSKSYLSRVTTLFSFFMSSSILFVFNEFSDPDLSIFILLALSSSFYYSYFLSSYFNLDFLFFVFFCSFLTLIGLEWSIAFLIEISILFIFNLFEQYHVHIKKKWLLLSLTLLLLVCFYLNFIGVHPGLSIEVVFLFGAAGAGGLQFLCLSKTEQGQTSSIFIYFLMNLFLGFFLKKEGETIPKVTLFFLVTTSLFFLFFLLVSKIKEETLHSVISQAKALLRGIFFPCLFVFDAVFFHGAYYIWITSFVIHVLILLLLKFILQNEDKDPILENEEKG